ncbi:Lipase (class 3) [Selenomonas ruminantium]|uniref:Lipase (Class 3) n=1 Tax=Selenomonas ruminantium TaxID=971 RepID=A0A1M6SQX9_SELRU|nr:hypothetical protein [Selenomonas ruminantium]SHK47123.1 Lipase (class 3) [Selenomonas ruminantium]
MRHKLILCVLCLLFAVSPVQAKELDRAELNFAAALISMSTYGAELNLLARQWLQDLGWVVDSHEYATALAEARVHILAKKLPDDEQIYVLAFPGTERKQDALVDLRMKRVVFAGQSPAEFEAAAERTDKEASMPLVHKGFHDYTQAALFSEKIPDFANLTLGEAIARDLRNHPSYQLYLTGHSLGGAAATLAAARLADLGVRPSQLRVITFGAPAVGNTAFARTYEKRMQLTRITIDGDPVKAALQSLSNYVQFGEKVVWESHLGRFPHDMTLYLDEALRHYQDAHSEQDHPYLVTGQRRQVQGLIYVAPFDFQVSDLLSADKRYMERVARGILNSAYTPIVFGTTNGDIYQEARKLGAKYILYEHFRGQRIKKEENNFRLAMEEELYDIDGNVLSFQSYSTTARTLTPIEAVGYLVMQAEPERSAKLKGTT